jgi:hypothetical protein
MKGWTERAPHTTKECDYCGKTYSPKRRCDNSYESEYHFMNSSYCSKPCQGMGVGRKRTETAAIINDERSKRIAKLNQAYKMFLYPDTV